MRKNKVKAAQGATGARRKLADAHRSGPPSENRTVTGMSPAARLVTKTQKWAFSDRH
jgi:hypothetical protein